MSLSDATALDPLSLALGIRVQQLREDMKMSKEALADRAGLAGRYLWRVEAGRQNITLRNLAALARALEVTISELMNGVEALAAAPPKRPAVKPRGTTAARLKAAAVTGAGDTAD